MVFGIPLARIVIIGIVGALVTIFIRDAAQKGLGQAFAETGEGLGKLSGIGTALGGVGQGIFSLFSGIGGGAAKLFDPLFTLRDLVFSGQGGAQSAPLAGGSGGTQESGQQSQPEIAVAEAFSGFVESGVVSQSFAESFSFQPDPTKFGTLDVSKTFDFLAAGGITPEEAQLAKLIEANSQQFPEFFQ